MNNKKGFTMVELLAVIVILGIISLIAVLSYGRISESIKRKDYEVVESSIKAASLEYNEATKLNKFYVQTLIDYGILSADNNGEIINPINDESMNCYIVNINGKDFSLTQNNSCEKDLYDYIKPVVTYCDGSEYNSSIWYNHTSICLKATLPEAYQDSDIKEIIWGNKNDGNFRLISSNLELNFKNNEIIETTYTVTMSLEDNNLTVGTRDIPIKNDLIKPIINQFIVEKNDDNNLNNLKYQINASDVKSGIKYLCYTENNDASSCDWKEVSNGNYSSTITIDSPIGSGGTYTSYAFAMDNAGNISTGYKYDYKLYKTCDEVIYKDGDKCNKTCNGTFNRLAYDLYNQEQRCLKKDTYGGGSPCNVDSCTYTIKYNANGGANAPQNGKKEKGVAYTIPSEVPTRNGFMFNNWNTKSDGTGTPYLSGGFYLKDEDVTLFAQWSCNKEYRCTTDGNYQSKCVNDSTWTNTGETCTKNCSTSKCSKECGGGSATRICYYEKDGHISEATTSSITCNTNACATTEYNCKVRGTTLINTVRYNGNTGWRWNCSVLPENGKDKDHIHYPYDGYDHETAYVHYCCLKDTNGNTLTDREHCINRSDNEEINKYSFICPCRPTTTNWILIDDYEWLKAEKGSKWEESMLGSKDEDCR